MVPSPAGLMKMFECCPNVKPENHPPVSGGSDAVAAGEGRFRSKLHECYANSLNPLFASDSTLPEKTAELVRKPALMSLQVVLAVALPLPQVVISKSKNRLFQQSPKGECSRKSDEITNSKTFSSDHFPGPKKPTLPLLERVNCPNRIPT